MRDAIRAAKNAYNLCTGKGKRRIIGYTLSLSILAIFDGVAIFYISQIFSSGTSSSFLQDWNRTNVQISVTVALLFIAKSTLSIIVTYFGYQEFAKQEVFIGQNNFKKILEAEFEAVKNYTQADYITRVDRAPNLLIQGLLLSMSTLVAESISGIAILAVLLVMEPVTALIVLGFFIFMIFLQIRFLTVSQKDTGETLFKNGNLILNFLTDTYNLRKILEIYKSSSLEKEIRSSREKLALARGKQTFVAAAPRYFMEIMLIAGIMIIGVSSFYLGGDEDVLSAVSIFAAAGFRLLPTINRIQGLSISIVGYEPLAKEALFEIKKFKKITNATNLEPSSKNAVELKNVSFKYENSNELLLEGVNLNFEKGKQYAIVGPSGSGKTTLIDLIVGLLKPTSGEVLINGFASENVFGYIPQDSYISSASLYQNVALEWSEEMCNFERITNSLEEAHFDVVQNLDSGIDFSLKGAAKQISGGQKQRIGLARALYRSFEILILDEATSSLDAVTESRVMESVQKLRRNKTLIIVAHRLSTIKESDAVIYLDEGKIQGVDTFLNLQKKVPNFGIQVKLGRLEILED